PPHPLHISGLAAVAAGHLRAEPGADHREPAHAGAADADEVELAARPVAHRDAPSTPRPAAIRTWSAIVRAALGLAGPLAALAICPRRASSPRIPCPSASSSAGSRASSSMISAAPPASIHRALARWWSAVA